MTETFKAGSIQSDLKVETESLDKGLSFAQKALDLFGDRTKHVASHVDAAGAGIAKSFENLAQQSSSFSKAFDIHWTKNKGAITSARNVIAQATTDMGVKFDLINRQNARHAQEFQSRWKQNQVAAAAATAEISKGSDAFGAIDRNTLRTTERFARLTNRLVGVQFAMQSLGGETTKGNKALEVGVKGLGVFASTAMLIPGPVGAASKDTAEALQQAKAAVEAFKAGEREREFQGLVQARLEELFPKAKDVQATKAVEDQIAAIRRLVTEEVALFREIKDLRGERDELNKIIEDPTHGLNWWQKIVPGPAETQLVRSVLRLKDVDKQLLQLQRNAPRAGKAIKEATDELANVRFAEKLEAVEKSMTEFRDQTTFLKEGARFAGEWLQLRKELLQVEKDLNATALNGKRGKELAPLGDQAKQNAREAFEKRSAFLVEQGKKPIFEDLKQQRREMELALTPLTRLQAVEEERKRTIEKIVELSRAKAFADNVTFEEEKAKAAAAEEVKARFEEMKLLANQQDFKDAFAAPTSAGIFQGLSEAMLNAEDAFKPLETIGRNLFTNMVDSFASQLQTKATEALTSVFGAGGTALGNLFTGILGIAGMFMSRKKGGANQSFDQISKQIESTQAVRGVVAGPTSVSIAAVGSDLRTAMVGVELRLDKLIDLGERAIRRMAGSSGGTQGAGGYPLPAMVPTQ